MEVGAEAVALAAAGIAASAGAWFVVRARFASVWTAMGITFGILAVLSVASGWVRWAGRDDLTAAIAVGLGSGVVLYLFTMGFLRVARGWSRLRRQTAALYVHREGTSLVETLGVSAAVVSPGEELFWRGLVQHLAVAVAGTAPGVIVAWVLYVAANLASASLPVVLGAVVGGAVWGALAWWSGGVAASVACHASWTALMIARPPV